MLEQLEQGPRRGKKRRPRKKRQTVVSQTPTEQGVVVPPGLLHEDRCRRRAPTPSATPRSKSTRSPCQASATSEPSGMSETSETSSTSSVGTLTRLHADLSSYSSDGRYACMWCPARSQSLMPRLKTEAEHRLK